MIAGVIFKELTIIPKSSIVAVLFSKKGTFWFSVVFLCALGSKTLTKTIGPDPNLLKCASIASHNV